MTISIFATKCRYCGEEVGKPKEETRELSTEDLGGETIYHRAPSGSVMEALESFRMEETVEAIPEEPATSTSGLFRKKSGETEPVKQRDPDLPELDESSKAMAEAVGLGTSGSSMHRSTTISRRREPTQQERLIRAGLTVAGIVVALVVAIKGYGWVTGYIEARNADDEPQYVNRAPQLLARGAPPLEILDEAAKALRIEDNSENRKYLQEAMDRVVGEFERLIHPEKFDNRAIWTMDNLNRASLLASRAAQIHANEQTARMSKEIEQELKHYRMTLLETNGDAARFAVNVPFSKSEWYEEADSESDDPNPNSMIADRFRVANVQSRIVRLEDTLRTNQRGEPRKVTYEVGSSRPL